jgi:hypothetical protein
LAPRTRHTPKRHTSIHSGSRRATWP